MKILLAFDYQVVGKLVYQISKSFTKEDTLLCRVEIMFEFAYQCIVWWVKNYYWITDVCQFAIGRIIAIHYHINHVDKEL